MKLILSMLILSIVSLAQVSIDPSYDNWDNEELILKLIEDKNWDSAKGLFSKEKTKYLKNSPSKYYLILSLIQEHDQDYANSRTSFEKSLNYEFSETALIGLLRNYSITQNWHDGLSLLEQSPRSLSDSSLSVIINFLSNCSRQKDLVTRVFGWTESNLKNKFRFSLFRFYIEELSRQKLINVATTSIISALKMDQINKPEEILILIEILSTLVTSADIHSILEMAYIHFPNSELIKINLAEALFKKGLYYNALNLMSELNGEDNITEVKLELMSLLNVRSYSEYSRLQFKDSGRHSKSWLVYFITNEKWIQVYSLSNKFNTVGGLQKDEFNYALAFSAQQAGDQILTRSFAELIRTPEFSNKRRALLDQSNLEQASH